jgi:asparagine synthase (glutamine-hydrolysing)
VSAIGSSVGSSLVETVPAYGFAVSVRSSELRQPQFFNRMEDGELSKTTTKGVAIVIRWCPATLEAAAEEQPVITPTVVLAYEGRVDNREEIAHALGQPRLAHQPDGAVLAAAYEAWGARLAAKTIGEYAYAVFDRRTQQLVAGQDSLGVRRLFYCAIGERVLVTSNLRLLFQQFPEARPSYDREVLREYFVATMTPWSGRTIWRGVRELRRGNALIQRGGNLEEQVVWRPDPGRQERFESVADVDERFRKLLFDAVRAALRSPGPVLCDLSGGFDSSTICSVAALLVQAGESRGPIIGWSMVNKRSDESVLQDTVRRQYQIESHTLDLDRHQPFQCFTDAEIPTGGFVSMGAIHRAMNAFVRARGIRSHLTGQAADILFNKRGGGPPVYLAEWLREGRFRDWARHFAAYLEGGSFNAWQLLRDCTVGTLDLHAGSREPIPSWVAPAFRHHMKQARDEFLHTCPRAFRSDARERVYRWTLCFIPYRGWLPDERLPFAYRPLVEFVLGLDWDHIVRPNEERLLMRRSLRDILPEAVQTGRSQLAFSAALLEGLRAAWPRISRYVTGDQLAALGVVERKPFQSALEAMRAGYWGVNTRIAMTALYLETWLGLKALPINAG